MKTFTPQCPPRKQMVQPALRCIYFVFCAFLTTLSSLIKSEARVVGITELLLTLPTLGFALVVWSADDAEGERGTYSLTRYGY
jgi:hypothetical protein